MATDAHRRFLHQKPFKTAGYYRLDKKISQNVEAFEALEADEFNPGPNKKGLDEYQEKLRVLTAAAEERIKDDK